MADMQKGLTRIPAIAPESGGKGEYARGKYLEPYLKGVFDEVKELHAPDARAEGGIRPNYAAVYKGKSNEKTIWIMAHMDTVPPGDEKLWKTKPFEAVERDGKLYGRGVEDNQQAIVSGFFSIKALKEEGVRPFYNIGLLLVSDEEIVDEYGAIYVLDHHRNIFGKEDFFIVPDGGDPKGETIEVAEKTFLWLKFITRGKQAHGAKPHTGINARRAAAYLIVEMDNLHKKYPQENPVFEEPPHSTIEPTLKIANDLNFNTIPGEDIMGFDCRLLPSVNTDEFIKSVRDICSGIENKFGVKIDMEVAGRSDSGTETPIASPVVRLVKQAVKDVNGFDAKPYGAGGMTVANRFRLKGFNAVAYSRLDDMAHQPNEYCVIDNMVNDAKVWAHVFLNAK